MKQLLKRLLAGVGLSIHPRYRDYFWGKQNIVQREIYGRRVLMPKSHTIVYNLLHFPYYNSNLQRIVQQYQQYRADNFSVVDVGANIGDTLLMIRQVSQLPVHCFEGNEFYFDLLTKNTTGINNAFLHKKMLSTRPGKTNFKSEMDYGTAGLVATSDGDGMEFDSLDNFLLNKYPGEAVGVLKTDTDGFDLKILDGASDILHKFQPVVFLEYDRSMFEKNNDSGTAFFDFMRGHSYDGLIVYDNYGKLLCVTRLGEEKTLAALHSYIKNNTVTFPFFDIALFSKKDEAFFNRFTEAELAFFEQ